jgi:RNA polymerase sigma factor (sigma-70 family)
VVEKLSFEDEKRGLLGVSNLIYNKVVDGERENVLLRLMGIFKSLRFEDLEEVYDDGCLVLWEKMNKGVELKKKSLVGYLVRICRNIGMHYLRKVNEDIESLDRIMERGYKLRDDNERGIEEMFDVMEEKMGSDDEIFERLDMVWSKLKKVDRMILESYYLDGCRMDEIAKRVGYRNGNSVKSKKNKVIKKMMKMMKEEKTDFKDMPVAA